MDGLNTGMVEKSITSVNEGIASEAKNGVAFQPSELICDGNASERAIGPERNQLTTTTKEGL